MSWDRKAKRKGYVAPYADRCQSPTEGKPTCQCLHDSSTEIMGPERKSKEDVAVYDVTTTFVVRSHKVDTGVLDVTILGLS